jgi:hypothetical protein
MKPLRIVYLSVLFAILALMPALPSVKASSGQTQTFTHLLYAGTTTFGSVNAVTATDEGTSFETSNTPSVDQLIPNSGVSAAHVPAKHIPTPSANSIATSNPGFVVGFNGITHRQMRLAGTGAYVNTQFNKEPPDQALCVGNGFVLESVNTAIRVFSTSGAPLTATTAVNQFFGLLPEVVRTMPRVFGNSTSDPKCYFDTDTNRFFLTIFELDLNSATAASQSPARVLLAVSQTGDPTGMWNKFVLFVTNDGSNGTPVHSGCPCFGDQPLIGADANGFYISTNEFSISLLNGLGGVFNGAQVYAMSKTALASGTLPTVVMFNTGTIPTPDIGGIWFTIQPATTPPGGAFQSDTEFFLSSLDFFSTTDNRIAVWAITGTSTLSSTSPSLNLSHSVISTETYGQPPDALQKDGSRPLAQVFIPQIFGGQKGEKLELLAGNDDRMNQVVFADGKLWAAVNTVVQVPADHPTTVGIAYFIVSPTISGSTVGGSIAKQGYVAASDASVMFPSIGVNTSGKGVMTFTLVGPNNFPSAAYATVDATNGAGSIHIASAGTAPEDGFTGYHFFGSPNRTARWGDYSAATADSAGNIWMGVEYIPNLARSTLANWGTFISEVTP